MAKFRLIFCFFWLLYSSVSNGTIPAQIVSVKGSSKGLIGENVSVVIEYDVSDGNALLYGLSLRVHFDSSALSISSSTTLLLKDYAGSIIEPKLDYGDFDNDESTDVFVWFHWASPFGNFPVIIPTDLVTLSFDVSENAPQSTRINFSCWCEAGLENTDYNLDGVGYELEILNTSWDMDNSANTDALTDGLLFLRYTFGLRGESLTAEAISSSSSLSTEQIETNLGTAVDLIGDIDGNNEVDALTDGLLLLRYLFGLTGDPLISSAVAENAIRSGSSDIQGYIESKMP